VEKASGMIKLVIFDLDGVLIDSRDVHYEALNKALAFIDPKFTISRQEHLSTYDGLNTTKKLEMLHAEKGLPKDMFDTVWKIKQRETIEIFRQYKPDAKLHRIFEWLRTEGYKIAVASNSIRETVKLALLKIGIMEYVDYYQSNEDVRRTKPFPEMYWNCMVALGATADETLIIEDSHIGRQGALASGAHLLAVEDTLDVSLNKVRNELERLNDMEKQIKTPWIDKNLNVVVPMAGAGSRFAAVGYTFPKPLIDVRGKPMIQVVVEALNIQANFVYIVQREHYEKYNLKHMLNLITPDCKIVCVDGITEGAAVTVLKAQEHIDNDNKLLIVNSDQYVEWNSNQVMYAFNNDEIDGGIVTFENTHPKWSYVRLDQQGFVSEVAEKKVISNKATVGMYYWRKGSDFCRYAHQMIDRNIRVNNEFYVAPVYNQAIADRLKIRIKDIDKMWGLGTPEDLNTYLQHN
jgi:HAD superfamily hydrolase (TIGR01509 family)